MCIYIKNKILVLYTHQIELDVSLSDFFQEIESKFDGAKNNNLTNLNKKYKYKILNDEIYFSKKKDFPDLSDPFYMIFTEIKCKVHILDSNRSKLWFQIGFSFELIIVNIIAIFILTTLAILFDPKVIVAIIVVILILLFCGIFSKNDLFKFIKEVCF